MTKDTVKLAGPDSADNYKVLATKGTLRVRPGEIYTERYVKTRLLDHRSKRDLDVPIIAPKFNDNEHRAGDKFLGTVIE